MSHKKKPASRPAARDRVVYEVTSSAGTRRVEATTTAELRDQLAPLLPGVEPYAVQAAARLASIERATVLANAWSVRRLGVLVFQPDAPEQGQQPQTARRASQEAEQRQEAGETSTLPRKGPQEAEQRQEAEQESAAPPQEAEQGQQAGEGGHFCEL